MIQSRRYRADEKAIELEKAVRSAARRKLAAGVEPRNPLNDTLCFHEPKTGRLLIIVAILSPRSSTASSPGSCSELSASHAIIIIIVIVLLITILFLRANNELRICPRFH
jgi:hypothetical protein